MDSLDKILNQLKDTYDIIDIVHCDGLDFVDLYFRIKQLYRKSYNNNHRIIFVITQDHHSGDEPGISLQYLQSIIADVDISNFFVTVVTTNQDIKNHYQKVFDNFSIDPVPFNLEICQGSYYKHQSNISRISLKKYSNINDQIDSIVILDTRKKNLLFKSGVFCLMPWLGMNIEPDSKARICCESSLIIGDCKENTLSEIWNLDPIKEVRRKILAGEYVESCQACYTKESLGRHTLRQTTNEKFLSYINKIDLTKSNGYLDDFDLKYWDIRYNNLCNLSCRSCNYISSSSWHQAAVYLKQISSNKSIKIAGASTNDIFQQMMEHINSVETIYFTGGEPLIIEEYYDILEELVRLKRTDVKLIYNTNLTKLNLKSRSILDLWREFPSVSVGASLDGEGKRGEYLREGCSWESIVSNRLTIMEKCPHVDFYISATTSILNVLHVPDFHKSWIDKGLIKPDEFNVQLLFSPDWLRIDSAPAQIKEQIKEKYLHHLAWLDPQDQMGRASHGFRSVLGLIESHREFDIKTFWHNIDSLDKFYDRDFSMTFPELSNLPRS